MEMAAFNRQRFSAPNYGPVSYPRNDYQSHSFMRDGPHMMRNMNENGPSPFQRFPGSSGGSLHGRHQYGNSDRMQGHVPFRPRSAVNQTHNSRMTPSGMLYRQQPYGGPDYFQNSNMGRMRHPAGPNERFFVPWNQRPEPYFGPRGPPRNTSARQSTFQQKSNARSSETPRKRKRNKKKKYNPRPREDAKKLKPWMTDEIYDEVRKKNELYVRAKNEDKPELWQEFKLVRNRVSSMIKDAKLKGGFITRKLKEDDDVDKPFSCDNCDRAFTTEADVEEHKQEHIKCDNAGCNFEAHPKVIELHKKMLHDTGYADVILKLNNTEEITKWRNERKSRYPTAENISKRKLELAEKIARGEVLETEQFGSRNKDSVGPSTQGSTDTGEEVATVEAIKEP